MFKCLNIIIFVSLMKITITSILRPDEILIRVKTPEEANGRPYFVDFIGLAKKYGYYTESHFITTEDGYILEVFRIPTSPQSPKINGKPVALLQHGLGASADIWGFFNRSLAYFLADAGFDVWIGNFRGNTYGRSHITLSPEKPLFWNFTWHESGKLDYPAMIDYILHKTRKPTLTLIGHSMGGTTIVVLLSERPEYNKKINLAVALAPSVYWKKKDPIRSILLGLFYSFKDTLDPTGMSEFFPQSTLSSKLINDFCKKFNILEFCIQLAGPLSGYDPIQSQTEDLLSVINNFPAGGSTKTIWHYCQNVQYAGEFRQYNYGKDNYFYYGQFIPPKYNVSNIITNLAIIYAKNDPFSTKEDNKELAKRVSTNALLESVKYPHFSHADFFLAKDIRKLLHNRLLEIISKYQT